MPAFYQPLSVRTGQRDPLPYHEGVPSHLRRELEEIVYEGAIEGPAGGLCDIMVMQLQIPSRAAGEYSLDRIRRYCEAGEENLLDALDYVLASQGVWSQDESDAPQPVADADLALSLGSSVWKVAIEATGEIAGHTGPAGAEQSPYRAGLRRRVPEPAEKDYLSALGIGGAAEGHLMTAWHAAYGRPSNPTTAWQYAVKAVEAALQPIVEPTNSQARLGAMRSKILQGPHNFHCQLPLWDQGDAASTVEAFTQGLSRVIYEKGHHGADSEQATQVQAQAVLSQAVTICEWIRIGVFTRAPQAQKASPGQ